MTDQGDAFASLRFDRDGLVPAVIQDADSAAVLMVGFMNAEALRLTRETGRTHFWSRSRGKLWRKGETSGHEQIVQDIYVNCELNTLLVSVTQLGAVCHDGYPTCFYRRIEDDGSLIVVRDRWFDPATVYGSEQTGTKAPDLQRATREWFGAYEYLRDNDLSADSSTSRRLRPGEPAVDNRIADELRELAGVLDGSHRHQSMGEDLLLEGSQVLYWIALAAVREGISWEALRLDIALGTGDGELPPNSTAKLLRRDADSWDAGASGDRSARLHATTALVGQACRSAGVEPSELIATDLHDLRSKPYLTSYFASTEDASGDA
ncbi:MAG: phosphoribosyl-AMP cyclohydrolase / phosphoribosyl-ATP pyrophosphohydrolase [Thermomicrobiales bacterium]|nr:phosphoribosyl-AMP cyclohydrolase / phosphoribosyl-ATP pyrophosphohydrolase [Thermomicrobiales bacterium]